VAAVIKAVQTKEIIHINETIEKQTIQETVNTSTYITKTPTH
jgi:hypothetical protein